MKSLRFIQCKHMTISTVFAILIMGTFPTMSHGDGGKKSNKTSEESTRENEFHKKCGSSFFEIVVMEVLKGSPNKKLKVCDKVTAMKFTKKRQDYFILRPSLIDIQELLAKPDAVTGLSLEILREGKEKNIDLEIEDKKLKVRFFDIYQQHIRERMSLSPQKAYKGCKKVKFLRCFYGVPWGTHYKYVHAIITKWFPDAKVAIPESDFLHQQFSHQLNKEVQKNEVFQMIVALPGKETKIKFIFLKKHGQSFLVGGEKITKLERYISRNDLKRKVIEKYGYEDVCAHGVCKFNLKAGFYKYSVRKLKGGGSRLEVRVLSNSKDAWKYFEQVKKKEKINNKREQILKEIDEEEKLDEII